MLDTCANSRAQGPPAKTPSSQVRRWSSLGAENKQGADRRYDGPRYQGEREEQDGKREIVRRERSSLPDRRLALPFLPQPAATR